MVKRIVVLSFAVVLLASLSGCASWGKKGNLEVQGLKNQISVLESQVQSKDQEISSLRESLDKTNESLAKGSIYSAKSHPKAKQIQIALRDAGFDPGKIDGKIGKKTIEAIKQYQQANNLPVTGKMDKKTWSLLRGSVIQKIK